MRFESFTIEKYGLVESRTLVFPPDPGLVVIYGPNEAGKSTSLAAIADFLFGIPHNSSMGHIYGYNQMRLTALVVLADGTRLSLRRRKGRSGRTMTDESGKQVDEALLSRPLGVTNRERFCSLFGLDHNTLRSGGERLLAADGEIGRLIVEAGGGLRALVDVIDKMARDADALFATNRAGYRRFYKALESYKAEDQAIKVGLLTREAYEEARRQEQEAQDRLELIRSKQKATAENISLLQRLVRVIPTIRELDVVEKELARFYDLPPLRVGFADVAQEALQTLKQADAALAELEEHHAALEEKINALTPSSAMLAAEAAIRDIQEKAVHIRKARGDRLNRQGELAERNAKLNGIRAALGLSTDADLEAMSPPTDAIERVQRLAAQGLEQRAKQSALDEQLAKEDRALANLMARQGDGQRAGTNEPLGVTIADFANLVALSNTVEAAKRKAERFAQEIVTRVNQLGFEDIHHFAAWPCPTVELIKSELEQRSSIESDIIRTGDRLTDELIKRDKAACVIEHFLQANEIPTEASISQARKDREDTWQAIRARYLSEGGVDVASRPLADRKGDAERQQQQTVLADRLADQKSLEAERVAALDLAQRQKAEALVAIETLEKQRIALDEQLNRTVHAWHERWPEARKRESDLDRLKALVEERATILERNADLREQIEEIDRHKAELAPRCAALEQTQAKLNLDVSEGASLQERVTAISKAIKIHEDAYADFRSDAKAIGDVSLQRQSTKASLNALLPAHLEWLSTWMPAVSALGLAQDIELERASEIATQWAIAAGLVDSLRLTRARLQRMDDDEKELCERVKTVAGMLDFELPDDCVAAAAMLGERLEAELKIASERRVLVVEMKERTAERDRKRLACETARAKVTNLCREAGCVSADLDTLAGRCRQFIAARDRHHTLAETILRSGDGLPVDILREQWAERDLDIIKADLSQAGQDAERLVAAAETALGEFQNCTRQLEKFSASGGINAAIAARESAITDIHDVVERYVEIALARDLLSAAMDLIRTEQQDPLILRASALFSISTEGAFKGIETDIDDQGYPVVVGRRASGDRVPVAEMSDGVRDQLFFAFRVASIEQYCAAAEPLPFIADDLLVHFDDDRGAAALGLLAELGKTTQVMLFTHHRHMKEGAERLAARGAATVIDFVDA